MSLFPAVVRWLILLVADLSITLLCKWVLAPFLPAFARNGHLPGWLHWFDTPDNPLDGDEGFMTLHAPFRGRHVRGWRRYINRVAWLRRNPGYGFSYEVLGATVWYPPIVVSGNPLISDSRNLTIGRPHGLSGHVLLRLGKHFEFYYVRQWGNSGRCLRIRLGWKLLGFVNEPAAWPLGGRAQFVCGVKLAGRFERC